MGKKSTKKIINKSISNPFSTGAGGATFEQLVGTSYLVSLLYFEIPNGMDGLIETVSFQQRYKGYLVDDIVVETKIDNVVHKLFLQVKHAITFSDNKLFRDVLKDCWRFFNSTEFSSKNDRLAIGVEIGSYPRIIAKNLQGLLQYAKTSNCAEDFIKITSKFKNKSHYLKLFRTILLRHNRGLTDEKLWQFLKCFMVLPFDLENEGSRDSNHNWNKLINLLKNRDPEMAKLIFAAMTAMIAEYAKSAGSIDYETAISRLPVGVQLNNPSNVDLDLRTIRGHIFRLVDNQIRKQKNSTKYIPNVFMEIDDIKEKARYFTDPILFWNKILDDVKRFDFSFLNKYLNELSMPPFTVTIPGHLDRPIQLNEFDKNSEELITFLEDKIRVLTSLSSINILANVPAEKAYFFDQVKYKYGNMWTYTRKTERILDFLKCINAKVLFLTSAAGQGKTNFICDLVENVMIKKSLLPLFFTASDFNNADLNDIGKYISQRLLPDSIGGSFGDAMKRIRDICYRDNCVFTVIIDGLNEHKDVSLFSQALELFTETLMKYDFVKVIFTCRSEYFNQRFSNFERASFSDKTFFLKDFSCAMNSTKKRRMLHAYFRFFRLSVGSIWESAYNKLSNDPLLLRIFCQAYGDHTSTALIRLAELRDIYKENLFRKYFEVKLDEIYRKRMAVSDPHIGDKIILTKLLRNIVEYMLEHLVFIDISLAAIFQKEYESALGWILEESIILRKDLKKDDSGILDESSEVLNFTFDEFRDFLISDYLMHTIYPRSKADFEAITDELTKHTHPISEGVCKYLFYISRRLNNPELNSILATKEWFNNIFLECIFSTDDRFITEGDIEMIKQHFRRDIASSSQTTIALINRHDTETFSNLNINVLFDILSEIDESQYIKLFAPIFPSSRNAPHTYISHASWKLQDFIKNLEDILETSDFKKYPYYHKLFETLLFMLGLKHDHFDYITIRGLYESYALKYPDIAIKQLGIHSSVNNKSISNSIWTILTYLIQRDMIIPAEFINDKILTLKGLTTEVADSLQVDSVVLDFLLVIIKKLSHLLSTEELSFISQLCAQYRGKGKI